jgi:hypothetical protein
MRFYLVYLEGTKLGLDDGPLGFFANRFVRAASAVEAEEAAKALSLKIWAQNGFATIPELEVLEVTPVGFVRGILSQRQNSGHTFYAF